MSSGWRSRRWSPDMDVAENVMKKQFGTADMG
jgi:hypothetical protein